MLQSHVAEDNVDAQLYIQKLRVEFTCKDLWKQTTKARGNFRIAEMVFISSYMHTNTDVYIYIYRERERGRETYCICIAAAVETYAYAWQQLWMIWRPSFVLAFGMSLERSRRRIFSRTWRHYWSEVAWADNQTIIGENNPIVIGILQV